MARLSAAIMNNVLTPPTEDLRGVGVHEAKAGSQEARAALHLALVTGRSVRGAADTGDSDTTPVTGKS